jgi:oligopeptide transport system substrate-binding protein
MEKTLRLSFQKDPLTLDPRISSDPTSSTMVFLLFKGLTRFEPDHTIRCDLANSFHILNGYKKFIFQLGRHFWSNGDLITAHDFVQSWKRAVSPNFPVSALNFFYHIKNAEKVKKGLLPLDKVAVYAENDSTLVVELEHPCPYFPELVSFCPFFPVSSKMDEDNIFSVYSGAFELQSWNKGKEIHLKRNLLCKGPTQLSGIEIRIIPDETQAFRLFENDELDWIGDPVSPLPATYLPALFSNKQIKPIAGVVSCWFNTLTPPFSNVNLRKAFAYAIPREKLLKKLLIPDALSADHFYPGILRDDASPMKECQETARELFGDALHQLNRKQLKITLSYEATDVFSRIAALLKAYWEEAFNMSIKLEPLSFKDFFQRLPRREFQFGLLRVLSQYTDVLNFLERFQSRDLPRNFSGWENSKYKTLLKRYQKTIDRSKRQILAKQAEKILLEEMPIAPIYYSHYVYMQKPHLHHLAISPNGIVQFDRVKLETRLASFSEDPLQVASYTAVGL